MNKKSNKNAWSRTLFRFIFIVTLLFTYAFSPLSCIQVDASDGSAENMGVIEKKNAQEKTIGWKHPELWSDVDSLIQVLVYPEDISMKSYTIHFKGARPGDSIIITNPGNCLVGDANIVEFDEDKKALLTILPRNHDHSSVFFISGLFRTKGQHIPFSIIWKPWATEVKYITGVDVFKENVK